MFRALCYIVLIIGHFPFSKPDAEECPSGCTCTIEQTGGKLSVSCETVTRSSRSHYSHFPSILPNNTRAFFFRVAEEAHMFDESVISFADMTWRQVEEITLQCVSYFQLNQTRLSGLSRLKILRLKDNTLTNILHPDAFRLTPNVEVLDLSYNPKLPLKSVVAALNESLPKLKYLELCNLQAHLSEPFILNKEFEMAIENKPLITLNVSNSRISFIDEGLTSESIRYLNLSKTYGLWLAYSPNINMVPIIEEIDISKSSYLRKLPGLETFEHTLRCIKLVLSIKRLIANNMRINDPIYVHDYRLRIMCNTISIEEIYIRYSNIRLLNFTIDKTLSNLKLLDFEGNAMEFLSPKLMQKIPNLQEIYLARNQLSTMENLGVLFEGNMVLRVVDLSHNGLQFIPWSMFRHNQKLATLRLQGNLLSMFHFSVEKLINLKLLDLTDNMIKYVSRDTIDGIESIGNQQGRLKIITADTNKFAGNETEIVTQMNKTILLGESLTDELFIDLTGNIMECTCDRIWFNEWVFNTHTSLLGKHYYTCKFDNNLNHMTSKLLNDMKYHCFGNSHSCPVFIIVATLYPI